METTDESPGDHDSLAWMRHAVQQVRRIERDYLAVYPDSLLCPACGAGKANPGLCPTCRQAFIETYRPRAD